MENPSSTQSFTCPIQLQNKIGFAKIYLFGSFLSQQIAFPTFDNLNINGDWCTEESISQNICYGTFNPELKPYIEDDFLIFPKDDKFKQRNLVNQNQVVTVGNYFECLDYSIGGFIPQSSANFFFNNKREAPKGFFVMLILTLFTMFYEMTYGTHKRKN